MAKLDGAIGQMGYLVYVITGDVTENHDFVLM